jgi:hypothetical protein
MHTITYDDQILYKYFGAFKSKNSVLNRTSTVNARDVLKNKQQRIGRRALKWKQEGVEWVHTAQDK